MIMSLGALDEFRHGGAMQMAPIVGSRSYWNPLGGVLSRDLQARHSIQDVKAHIRICILRNADFFIRFRVTV